MTRCARVLVCYVWALVGAVDAWAQKTFPPPPFGNCATPDPERQKPLFGEFFGPSDCSLESTNPTPDYDPGPLYEIPVVVHIVMDDACIQGALSDETVHSQIEILNEDFLALPGTNGGNGTDTQIRFALATVDPDGNPTSGITRTCNTNWFNDDDDGGVEYWDVLAWDPHNYLNLYTHSANGARGYVPFLPAQDGGIHVGQPHDRVVVNWQAFGPGGPFPPHADGRTATHEIGHYLGLLHTFNPSNQCGAADPPDCYQDGDLICDTAVEENPADGCPTGMESCGSLDPITNYMNYSDDLCLEEFTLEQARRLRCTLPHYRPDLYVVKTAPALMFDPANLDFGDVEVGTTSAPQVATLHNDGSALATGLAFAGLPDAGFTADTGDCGSSLAPGASCEVSVTFTPEGVGAASATLEAGSAEGSIASLAVEGEGLPAAVVATAMDLVVDPESAGTSDGNGIFEPAELVTVAPAWRNDGASATELAGGAAAFEGPAGANYSLTDAVAGYGLLAPGATGSCLDTDDCYQMGLNDPATRPAAHWDATFEETVAGGPTRTWTLHVGDSFADVPRTSPFYPSIETLLHAQVTGGCGAGAYCPGDPNTRAQMPVFLLKALEGGAYTPPACTGVFADVPCPSLFANWIEDLVARGVTAGCGGGNYCPANPVSRDQMAVFLLKTLEGPSYAPPPCTGVFGDVPCPSLFTAWIEDLVAHGITAGCGGGNYCPGNPVSRDQMAVFLAKTFGLTLYGP